MRARFIPSIIFSFISLSFPLSAAIQKVSTIDEFLTFFDSKLLGSESQKKILIIWDIDLVLLVPEEPFGQPIWYDELEKKLEASGINPLHSRDLSHLIWDHLFSEIPHKTGHSLLLKIKNRFPQAWKQIALTARSLKLSNITDIQLERAGYSQSDFDDIIYADLNPKGTVLGQWVKRTAYKLDEIWFIDDRKHNLESVEEFAQNAGILFRGFFLDAIMNHEEVKKAVERQTELSICQNLLSNFTQK